MSRASKFSKYVGTGNDFLFFDKQESAHIKNRKRFVQKICDRHFGVGADGVVFMEESKEYDFSWDFYNADGSHAEMCGNAARCAVQFYGTSQNAKGKHDDRDENGEPYREELKISFQTQAGVVQGIYSPEDVPIIRFSVPQFVKEIEGGELWNAGVPHFVLQKNLGCKKTLREMGRMYRHHSQFQPNGVNVTFLCPSLDLQEQNEVSEKNGEHKQSDAHHVEAPQIKDPSFSKKCIDTVTYERGVEDLTLACGTGALAAASSYRKQMGENTESVQVNTLGGVLSVLFEPDEKVVLKGSVSHVFSGEFS